MIRRVAATTWMLLIVALATPMSGAVAQADESLAGKLLVAAPSMPDPRFQQTVIYMCVHDSNGALGLIVNRRMGLLPGTAIADQFKLDASPSAEEVPLHWGGPVDPGRGFVLHTSEYTSDSTEPVGADIAFSIDTRILTDLVEGQGPNKALLIMGYSGWAAGQLESELKRDDWAVVPGDAGFVFSEDLDAMWRAALDLIEVDL